LVLVLTALLIWKLARRNWFWYPLLIILIVIATWVAWIASQSMLVSLLTFVCGDGDRLADDPRAQSPLASSADIGIGRSRMRVKWGNHESTSRRPNKALNIVEDRPALHISIVPTPTWYWSAFGWGDGLPALPGTAQRPLPAAGRVGLARRHGLWTVWWRGLRPLASASHRFSPIRGRRRRSVARQP
jgi:hypothetical protein